MMVMWVKLQFVIRSLIRSPLGTLVLSILFILSVCGMVGTVVLANLSLMNSGVLPHFPGFADRPCDNTGDAVMYTLVEVGAIALVYGFVVLINDTINYVRRDLELRDLELRELRELEKNK